MFNKFNLEDLRDFLDKFKNQKETLQKLKTREVDLEHQTYRV